MLNIYPLQRLDAEVIDLKGKELYFILSRIEAIEAEWVRSKINIITSSPKVQKCSYALILKTFIGPIMEALASQKLVYRKRSDCVKVFYKLGLDQWDSIPARNIDTNKAKEQRIQDNIVSTLGTLNFWKQAEPYKQRQFNKK